MVSTPSPCVENEGLCVWPQRPGLRHHIPPSPIEIRGKELGVSAYGMESTGSPLN
jgi:hypothetical protein